MRSSTRLQGKAERDRALLRLRTAAQSDLSVVDYIREEMGERLSERVEVYLSVRPRLMAGLAHTAKRHP